MSVGSKLSSVALIGIMVAAGAGAALWFRHATPGVQLATGEALLPRRELGDFSLIDHHGQNFGRAQLRGGWSLMFFGYTNCPDFCPTTLATLAALEKHLRGEQAKVLPRVLFVSVDAKRDTPAQLARYVPYFDPGFIGLTAPDQAGAQQVASTFGVAVVIHPEKNGTYLVDHSGAIFVLDPQARVAAILSGPYTVETLAQDLARLEAARS